MSMVHSGRGDERAPLTTRTLSTGQEIALPLSVECTIAGGAFPAARQRLNDRLPDRLSPVRLGPGVGVVVLAGIEYHQVGPLAPYEEFATIVPVVRDGVVEAPLAQLCSGELGGYVTSLPVTTEPARALGIELWGYPKTVADIGIETHGTYRRTVLSTTAQPADGGDEAAAEPPEVVLSVRRSRITDRTTAETYSYSTMENDLVRTRAAVEGRLAVKPLDQGTSVALGDGPYAAALRSLELRDRPLARVYGERVSGRLFPPVRLR